MGRSLLHHTETDPPNELFNLWISLISTGNNIADQDCRAPLVGQVAETTPHLEPHHPLQRPRELQTKKETPQQRGLLPISLRTGLIYTKFQKLLLPADAPARDEI